MIKTIIILMFFGSLSYGASNSYYKKYPSSDSVENIYYDKKLNVIILHVRAKICFLNIDKVYGIEVNDNKDIDNRLREVVGKNPKIFKIQ